MADSGPPGMSTITPRDQLKPIRIGTITSYRNTRESLGELEKAV